MLSAAEFVRAQLKRLHTGLEKSLADLTPQQLHAVPGGHPKANTIGWGLWHYARTEDNIVRWVIQERRPPIWTEAGYAGRPRNAGSIRRDVQRWYLTRLTRMVVSPALGTPEDARSVARATLTELGGRLDRALAGAGLDAYTRAHYTDSRQRIRQVLNAQVVQATGVVR